MQLRRLFLYLLIGSVGLSALIAIGVLLFGDFGEVEIRVLMTTWTLTVTSVFGLACGAYLDSGRGRYVPLAGIVLSIIAAAMALLIIWNALDDNETFIKSFLTATLLAGACSHFSLLSLARLDRRFAWTRIAGAVSVVLLCAILLYIMWFEPEGESDLIYRVLGILGVMIASVTVVTPVFHKLSSATSDIDAIDREIAELESRLAVLRAQKPNTLESDS